MGIPARHLEAWNGVMFASESRDFLIPLDSGLKCMFGFLENNLSGFDLFWSCCFRSWDRAVRRSKRHRDTTFEAMIAALSPAGSDHDETTSTLQSLGESIFAIPQFGPMKKKTSAKGAWFHGLKGLHSESRGAYVFFHMRSHELLITIYIYILTFNVLKCESFASANWIMPPIMHPSSDPRFAQHVKAGWQDVFSHCACICESPSQM